MELFFSLHEIFLPTRMGIPNLWHVYRKLHESEWTWINIGSQLRNIYVMNFKYVFIQW
jgi:hypothetical protein